MKSAEIRQAFLDFFNQKSHAVVASSSLIPGNDPTLLFTNAGMNQFKDVFLGREQRDYNRATSSQRCVRAGGKHNDLENVGYTARHHTFFEMLGNFSFGDYFKRDAIAFAWEFLTQTLGLPEEKLWVTVHVSDDETADIWLKEMGVSAERFSRLGEDNFWQMGDTGPCGPCTEIFYDHGEDIPGGPPGSKDEDLDRYIEIWNLVFMQYDRQPDGEMKPLPKPSVDTGMGLERIAAVMQGVHTNYEIDLFQNLIKAAIKVTGTQDTDSKSLQVLVDHIRSCSFLIADGVVPSNEGRGYVLRRIIRRALRHGNHLGCEQHFFYKLVQSLVDEMGDAYPELNKSQAHIEQALLKEEQQFAKTLDQGLKILEEGLQGLPDKVIPGELIFKLYDTYGFPADLTGDIGRERGLDLDMEGFEACMEQQRQRARKSGGFTADYHDKLDVESETDFLGYDNLQTASKVEACFIGADSVAALKAGEEGVLVLDHSPFYAESGGQAGDTGEIVLAQGRFVVEDTQKKQGAFLHLGKVIDGEVNVGDEVTAQVSQAQRQATVLNHSATHLLHAALRTVLGEHVTQKGSLVNAKGLRFDFSNPQAVTADELREVERLVNAQIRGNSPVTTELMTPDQAEQKGAMALFGEKYGKEVRVLSMGDDDFSVELCGGTHARQTGDIGLFKITGEGAVAAGVRRIEALTGSQALGWVERAEQALLQTAELLKGSSDTVVSKVKQLSEKARQQEKEIASLKQKLATGAGGDLAGQAKDIGDAKLLAAAIDGADAKSLRVSLDQLKSKLGSAVIILAAVNGEKVALVAGVTEDLTGQVKAGELVNFVAQQIGGKGGGRADMAQAGGTQPQNLAAALESTEQWLKAKLTG